MKKILLIILLLALGSTPHAKADIGIGSSKEELITLLGQPEARANQGNTEIFFYGGRAIEIQQGKITHLSFGVIDKALERKQKKVYEEKQRSKGLVQFEKRWVTAKQKASLAKEKTERLAAQAPKIKTISAGGKRVELNELLVKGKVTMVDFYADWCGPCRMLSPKLEHMAKTDGHLFLRKVDIINWNTAVAKQFQLQSIPNVRIFDGQGKMVGRPSSNIRQIQDYVNAAKKTIK